MIAKQSSVIFDVGAYTGLYTLIASKTNNEAKIYSFEPNPIIFEALKKNVKINNISKKCRLLNLALSNTTEERYLFQNAEFYTSQFSLNQYAKDSQKIKVLTTELDFFFKEQNLNNLDLMKIDAEGFEKYIIIGGLTTLTRFHPIILMEALTDDELITQKNLLKTIGYTSLFRVKGTESDCRNYLWINANSANYENLKKVLPTDKLIILDF